MRERVIIPTITAFEASPDRGQGLARDTRVRWLNPEKWAEETSKRADAFLQGLGRMPR